MGMTEKEVNDFDKKYRDKYNWRLVARTGNSDDGYDSYLYKFVDDLNICITINPNDKSFSFSKIVDHIFRLESGDFSPLDYNDHFERNYIRFRKIVISKGLS